MILFSLIFSQKIIELPRIFRPTLTNDLVQSDDMLNEHKIRNPFLAYAIKNIDFVSKSKENSINNGLVYTNCWQNLASFFRHQSIFLSPSNNLSNKYIAELNSLNLRHNDKSNYKYLLSEFSKSLAVNSIKSSFSSHYFDQNGKRYSSVEYLWRQIVDLKKINCIFNLLRKDKGLHYSRTIDYSLRNQLHCDSMPLYVISNHLGQMVLAEPPEDLSFNYFPVRSNTGNLCEGWFFISFEDAQEYLEYIAGYYGLNSSNRYLRIFTCNLATFYELSSTYNNKVSLRLVPDLNEVGSLVKKYRHYDNIIFHEKQKYGKNYFNGQPIYMIKDTRRSSSQCNYYETFLNKNKIKYKTLFTNYETAIDVCKKLKRKQDTSSIHYKMSQKPMLLVYNLEHFIQEQAVSKSKDMDDFLLIPSKSSYKYAKLNQLKKRNILFLNDTLTAYSYIKLWIKRVFWSLTSKQPIS